MDQAQFDATLDNRMGHSSHAQAANIKAALKTCFGSIITAVNAFTANANMRAILLGRAAEFLYQAGEELASNVK